MAGITNCFDYFIASIDETLTESGIFNNNMNIQTSQQKPTVDCPDEEYIPLNPPRSYIPPTTIHRHIKPTTECVDEEHSIHI